MSGGHRTRSSQQITTRTLTLLSLAVLGLLSVSTVTSAETPAQPGVVTATVYGDARQPLAGATVAVFMPDTDTVVGSCVTLAPTGTCSVDNLPYALYQVGVTATPAGFSPLNQIWLGSGTGTPGANQANRVLVTVADSATPPTAALVVQRGNRAASARCGMAIAIAIDTSGSTIGAQASMKTAAKHFVESMAGTPSHIAVGTFASTVGPHLLPLTPAAQVSTIESFIDAIPAANGATNWETGIGQLNGLGADLAIVITDGNPTLNSSADLWGDAGDGANVVPANVAAGVGAANTLKHTTRVVAVGLGLLGDVTNLKAISGGTPGSDYFTGDYTDLGSILQTLALASCGGSVTIEHQVENPTGVFTPTGGWTFTSTATSGSVTPPVGTPSSNGLLTLDVSGGSWTAKTVTIVATDQPGFTRIAVAGHPAACTNQGVPITVVDVGSTGVVVPVGLNDIIHCTFRVRVEPAATTSTTSTTIAGGGGPTSTTANTSTTSSTSILATTTSGASTSSSSTSTTSTSSTSSTIVAGGGPTSTSLTTTSVASGALPKTGFRTEGPLRLAIECVLGGTLIMWLRRQPRPRQ